MYEIRFISIDETGDYESPVITGFESAQEATEYVETHFDTPGMLKYEPNSLNTRWIGTRFGETIIITIAESTTPKNIGDGIEEYPFYWKH